METWSGKHYKRHANPLAHTQIQQMHRETRVCKTDEESYIVSILLSLFISNMEIRCN